jgi:hypothetical protein
VSEERMSIERRRRGMEQSDKRDNRERESKEVCRLTELKLCVCCCDIYERRISQHIQGTRIR